MEVTLPSYTFVIIAGFFGIAMLWYLYKIDINLLSDTEVDMMKVMMLGFIFIIFMIIHILLTRRSASNMVVSFVCNKKPETDVPIKTEPEAKISSPKEKL